MIKKNKLLKIFLITTISGILLAITGLASLYFWVSKDLPTFAKVTDYRPPLVTTVLASDGEVLGYLYKEKRFLVGITEMSPWIPKAFLAAEDASFYVHEGVDFKAIFRAALINFKAGETKQGASTITQQLIKGLLLTSERSYKRKLKEAILAYRLERYLTKDEILTLYLNHIFLGASSYGVEAASRTYFGKHAKDLTIGEAALLAGLPKAPSYYNPLRSPQQAKTRQVYVLGEMLKLNMITAEQHETAVYDTFEYKNMDASVGKIGAYYLEEVRRWLIDKYGEDEVYTAGLTVQTACSLEHQEVADRVLRAGLEASALRRGWRGPNRTLGDDEIIDFLLAAENDEIEINERIEVLVVKVEEDGATVRFGSEHGYIPVSGMSWARTPDIKLATEEVRAIADARKVLKRNDVVWALVVEKPIADTNTDNKNTDDKTKTEDKKNTGGWTLSLVTKPVIQGAIMSMEPETGNVVAMTGGYDFSESQFNRATQAHRQAGSAFKAFTYSVALDKGYTVASTVLDAPIVVDADTDTGLWRPGNYEDVFYGPTLLRTALVRSRNLVTIRLAQSVGISSIIKRATIMGARGEYNKDLSVALGSGSITLYSLLRGYTPFARGGTGIEPQMVLSVKDSDGKEVYVAEQKVYNAITPQNAYIMTSLMRDVVRYGTAWRARSLGRNIAGKTGTSNDEKDAWFIGYTPYLLTGVYVGFDDYLPMGRLEAGSRAAGPIWVNYRKEVEPLYPATDFIQPEGIDMVRIDAKTGLLAGPSSKEVYFLPFKEGTAPTEVVTEDAQDGVSAEDELLKQIF